MCVCIALCTIVAHDVAQNRPDNIPSYPHRQSPLQFVVVSVVSLMYTAVAVIVRCRSAVHVTERWCRVAGCTAVCPSRYVITVQGGAENAAPSATAGTQKSVMYFTG